MKILVAHNQYQERGGEDVVVEAEVRLMEAHGHRVTRYDRHNDELKRNGALGAIAAGIDTIWSAKSLREVRALLAKEKPDLAHVHNTFPLISPAIYEACADFGVPVVQTLHNYRLLCPAATLLREGAVCEACLGRSVAWPAVAHACYRGSYAATGTVAAMLAVHRAMGTWQRKVDLYIALSEFSRRKFIAGGLPSERIAVKPNFVEPDPGPKRGLGEYALFVGRLVEYKGLRVLLDAWANLRTSIPLHIAGDGPLLEEITARIEEKKLDDVTLVGRTSRSEIISLMQGARFLVFPSLWFEGFPVTIAEAFACGVPVIASRLGSLCEIVVDGRNGLHVTAGDADDLAAKVERAWNKPEATYRMGRSAREQFEREYTGERNYSSLMYIYERAIARGMPLDPAAACDGPSDSVASVPRKAG